MSPPLLYWWMSGLILRPLQKQLVMWESDRTRISEMGQVHPSCMAASVGSIPSNLGDLRWCCCNNSSSWQKRAWCHLEEEQWALRGTSSSALLESSPEPTTQEEEDLEAKPKVLPLGFQEIAKSLTTGESPDMEVDCPLTKASQDLSVGSTVATVTSHTMCQDQTTGIVYLSTVTTSMGLMNLEVTSVMVGHQGLTVEGLMEEDMAEGHLK